MKRLLNILLCSVFVSLVAINSVVAGESIVVIVNAENSQQLTEQQIKNIYADIVTQWDNGNKITVYNLYADEEARETFSQKVFGESAHKQVLAESNRKITNTIKNPSKTKSARLVLKMVSRNPNAIGYVPKSMVKDTTNVRIVLQID